MPNDASATDGPTGLSGRVRLALESGDLDAIRDLLDPGARWGAPEGPGDADCRRRDQVLTLRGDRIIDIRGFGDRAAAAGRAGLPA